MIVRCNFSPKKLQIKVLLLVALSQCESAAFLELLRQKLIWLYVLQLITCKFSVSVNSFSLLHAKFLFL